MIARVALLLLAVVSGACAARGGVPRPFPGAPLPPSGPETPPTRVEAPPAGVEAPAEPSAPAAVSPLGGLISTALELIGAPYRNGGSNPTGFDCSGFVQWVFGRHGLSLPRDTREQYKTGRQVDLDEVREGDLLFFETVARGASHVGIALGQGRFVHAPSSRGVVRVEPYTASYWARRFVGARRVRQDVEEAEHRDTAEDVKAPVRPRVFPGATRSSR